MNPETVFPILLQLKIPFLQHVLQRLGEIGRQLFIFKAMDGGDLGQIQSVFFLSRIWEREVKTEIGVIICHRSFHLCFWNS